MERPHTGGSRVADMLLIHTLFKGAHMGRKRSVRDWVYIGIFGALWGGIELSLGSLLHMLFPPLTGTFFTGLILGSLGCIIALTGYSFVPGRGTVLLIGFITAILKLISPAGVKIGPVVAIIAESLLIEAALLLETTSARTPDTYGTAADFEKIKTREAIREEPPGLFPVRTGIQKIEKEKEDAYRGSRTRRNRLYPYVIAGMLCLAWNLPHRFIMLRILFGKNVTEVALKMAKDASAFIGLHADAVIAIIAVLLAIRMAAGALSGFAAWKLAKTIRRRTVFPYEIKN